MKAPLVLNLDQIRVHHLHLVGGECASLSERILSRYGFNGILCEGFAITTEVYRKFILTNQLDQFIKQTVARIPASDETSLLSVSANISNAVINAYFPP